MMTNLFSTFDPSTKFLFSINWISSLLGFIIIPMSMWTIPSRLIFFWKNIFSSLNNEIKILLNSENKMNTLFFISLFFFILFNNSFSLFPYIFPSNSHLTSTLSMSLPIWISFMMFGWLNNYKHMLAHLVPMNTPSILMPFMVLIESISNIIRPGTLAIRLSANLIAGHLILSLMGETGNKLTMIMINILILSQIILLTLESAVAIIQSYVFMVLSTLYSNEIN
uniref:ATP synthase subunit a n=1 Tax=Lucidina sp. FM13 TaxID=2596686 RepID=A0A5C0PWB3_9COLE|nr:ATP synthase F0 subunit 6 [Lucidina sp. FM13]